MKTIFERQFKKIFGEHETDEPVLSPEEKEVITLKADIRQESQQLKVNLLNIDLDKIAFNETERWRYERIKNTIFQELGEQPDDLLDEQEKIILRVDEMKTRAEEVQDFFPELAAYLYATIAKIKQDAGQDQKEELFLAKENLKKIPADQKLNPSLFLPDAIILGVEKKEADKKVLPEKEKIAQAFAQDPKILSDYALVLTEKERDAFLKLLPLKERKMVSILLDTASSKLLHSALIEKEGSEIEQRKKVKNRIYEELLGVLAENKRGDKILVKLMAQAMGELGGDDTRQLLLETLRDEYGDKKSSNDPIAKKEHLPRIIKVFLDNFDDWRGNDLVLQLAGEEEINPHLSIYLINKLIKNNYLPKDIKTWWSERKATTKNQEEENWETAALKIIKKVISELKVIPSRDILNFIGDDVTWKNIPLTERIEQIKLNQEEFETINDNHELARKLANDENKAMIYYLLYGGQDHFNLINNYSFEKFKEMVGQINDLKIHPKPLGVFAESLNDSGVAKEEIDLILEKLKRGEYPLRDKNQARQEVSFDVSENMAIKNANLEIGRILGKEQLGVILIFPLYREYLLEKGDSAVQELIDRMKNSTTLASRRVILDDLDRIYPDFKKRAMEELKENWRLLGEKMVLNVTLDQVFDSEIVPIKGEEILPRLDSKRFDLKKMKRDLLVALKGENPQMNAAQKELLKKKKARQGLMIGLEKQTAAEQKQKITQQIEQIDQEIKQLEEQINFLGDLKVTERFNNLTPEQKKQEMERLSQEIIALTEKSPSAIFTYLTMQVLGEERLTEHDISLVKEIESHLQSPFQTIGDKANYQAVDRQEKKRMKIVLEYLDKTKRFMNMVRFADSKICCFSSSNYEMVVGHNTPNKYWVASINADPLSFVISMEIPNIQNDDEKNNIQNENIGFIFGSFGVDKEGRLGIMLNGIYYAPGIESQDQTEEILAGVEKIFKGLSLRTIAFSEQHGGALGQGKIPIGYTNDTIELTRLRALDDNSGDPETKIYDDLGTGNDLNKPHDYHGKVWHKNLD